MHITRRTLASGLALSLGLGGLGVPLLSLRAPPDYERLLQSALDALAERLSSGTRIVVTGFEMVPAHAKKVDMIAHIHMSWAPGERQIPYTAQAVDSAAAFEEMRTMVVAHLEELHRPVPRHGSMA